MTDERHPARRHGIVARLDNALTAICRLGAGLSFALLIASVTLQVVSRTLGSSPVWTEEVTRFGLLYLAAFGAGAGLRTGDLVNVDLFAEAMPAPVGWALRLLSAVAIVVLSAILIEPSWRYTAIGAFQTSPALGLQMTYVHVTVLLLLAVLGLFALFRVIGMLTGSDDGRPHIPADDPGTPRERAAPAAEGKL
ncbi:TRAP transporter small permease [Acuticoccus sp. MNP-M23]|uniref:TRAP transporter small permease n=1 Tax=Acuticoccus sp. MNP-M23 TaxID=3072793 RepID=UPI002815D2B9|nr:TRAP transporter small permease [Acuticoccus sp. MNP-M23]WMS44892.1 TRAP transporter small permease [Acuticoccus sp. MNP-M23]